MLFWLSKANIFFGNWGKTSLELSSGMNGKALFDEIVKTQ